MTTEKKDSAPMNAVAREYMSLLRQWKFDEAMQRFFSPDMVRVDGGEMGTTSAEMHGVEAIKANSGSWAEDNEVHAVEIDGPFLGENRFAVRFIIDATLKLTGERTTIAKMELNTVEGAKVTRQEIYYDTRKL